MTNSIASVDVRRPLGGLSLGPGRPLPFGASTVPGGINFSVNSATAKRIWLVLMDPRDGAVLTELPFPDYYRTGSVFTLRVSGLDPAEVDYGFRVEPHRAGPGAADRSPVLLDPYAHGLAGGGAWGERPHYRSRLVAEEHTPPATPRPRTAAEDLVIYELHVRGFTRHPSSGVSRPGTFAGLREKIPYLRDLGVNCVELLPIAEFD